MDQNYPSTTGQAPPAYGSAPPTTGYPPQQPYANQPYVAVLAPQQQPVVVGVSQQTQTFVGHIVFSCVVCWCCNGLFGLIAFILAMVANNNAMRDPAGARTYGNASIGVSVAGIVVTVVVVVIVVAVEVAAGSCPYTYEGTCYLYKDYVGTYGSCSGVKTSDGWCYHN